MDDRWLRGRAGRQEMGIDREKAGRQDGADHQKVLQDQHHSPWRRKPRWYQYLVGR
jgi:hypothetical protein